MTITSGWTKAATLHLRLTKQGEGWYYAEIFTKARLSFGRYRSGLWDAWIARSQRRVRIIQLPDPMSDRMARTRLTSSFAQWGQPEAAMGNYTVWPAREGLRRASQRFSVELKGEFTTHGFTWNSTGVAFESLHGHRDDSSNKFADWLYKPHDPPAYIFQKAMPIRINVWLFQGQPPRNGQQVELIVRSFKFTPAMASAAITEMPGRP